MNTLRSILCLIVAALLVCHASAQAPDETTTERFLLDFVVPDMPAFKALNTNPSDILRPADVKKFALSLSPFYSNGTAVIPKHFAVEFAPWKLASSKWTLASYNTNPLKRILYNSSFSLGAIEDSTDFPSKLGTGARLTIISKRGDILYQAHAVIPRMQAAMATYQTLTNYWVTDVVKPPIGDRPTYYQNHKKAFRSYLSKLEKSLQANPNTTLQQLYDAFITSIGTEHKLTATDLANAIETLALGIDEFIAAYKEENWNASRFDFATAWVGESGSNELAASQFSSTKVWLTWAIRAHKNGQLLVSTQYAHPRMVDNVRMTKWSSNLRYYAGTQAFRGFLETQYKVEKHTPIEKSILVNVGAELRIGSRFWITASGGLNNYLSEAEPVNKLLSSIDLKYGFNDPDKK